MALRTKCIKNPPSDNDGLRISIMSRHTLSDGITPDLEITDASFAEWWPELAPPPNLIGAYYKRGLVWETFAEEFKKHLASPQQKEKLEKLIFLSRNSNVTILCIEPTPEHCHRRLVAEACQKIDPSLEMFIG